MSSCSPAERSHTGARGGARKGPGLTKPDRLPASIPARIPAAPRGFPAAAKRERARGETPRPEEGKGPGFWAAEGWWSPPGGGGGRAGGGRSGDARGPPAAAGLCADAAAVTVPAAGGGHCGLAAPVRPSEDGGVGAEEAEEAAAAAPGTGRRRHGEGGSQSRSRAGPRESNSKTSSSFSSSVSAAPPPPEVVPRRARVPAQAGPHRWGAREEARAGSGTARPPLGERPRGNGRTAARLPPACTAGRGGLVRRSGSRWMGPVPFATCPPPSSRAAAPASAPFVCWAPRARGGARPCGGTGAAARPARREAVPGRAGEALPCPRRDRRGSRPASRPRQRRQRGPPGSRAAPLGRCPNAPRACWCRYGGRRNWAHFPLPRRETRLQLSLVCPRLRPGGCPEVAIWGAAAGVCAMEEPRVVTR